VAFLTHDSVSIETLDLVTMGVTFVLTFVAAAVSLYFVFQQKSETLIREDLSIQDIVEDDDGNREIVIKNDSDGVVHIRRGKIEDTDGIRYSLDGDLRFRPGEKKSLQLPEGFSLATTEQKAPAGMGQLYERRITSIYARSGDTFVLEWDG
jgi:hypothetical protein